ncbi:MAG: type II/IV secretion system ATPase subunit [archaeon]
MRKRLLRQPARPGSITSSAIVRGAISKMRNRVLARRFLAAGAASGQRINVNVTSPQQAYPFSQTLHIDGFEREKKDEDEDEDSKFKGFLLHEGLAGETSAPVSAEWKEKSKANIRESYPLIASETGQVFSYVQIFWSPEEQCLIYQVIEPQISPEENELLRKIEKKLEEKLDIDFAAVSQTSQFAYLKENFYRIVELFNIKLSEEQRARFEYYLFRDFVGLNEIEPLMHDPQIEDISCDGVGIPAYIVHRNPEYGEMRTNITFKTKAELDSFAVKLAQRCRRAISVATPLLDATLPDGSRLQATLGSDIARRGSNFTIRKFSERPFTPVDLIEMGTLSTLALAYIWFLIEQGKSILVSGATATGKTTALNAISLFIQPTKKIVSIEDTAELQLPHPNWIPQVARAVSSEKRYGSVEMFDLLKASLRQRPDYIIVGEVRGAEANVMFQGMATGHPALGTLHADNVQKVVDRLVTPPISLSPAMLENLDAIIFIVRTKLKGQYVRRASQIVEIRKVMLKDGTLKSNTVFEWNAIEDKIVPKDPSIILEKLAHFRGITEASILSEIARRAKLLEWLKLKHVKDYRLFASYVAKYYTNPAEMMQMVSRELHEPVPGKIVPGAEKK